MRTSAPSKMSSFTSTAPRSSGMTLTAKTMRSAAMKGWSAAKPSGLESEAWFTEKPSAGQNETEISSPSESSRPVASSMRRSASRAASSLGKKATNRPAPISSAATSVPSTIPTVLKLMTPLRARSLRRARREIEPQDDFAAPQCWAIPPSMGAFLSSLFSEVGARRRRLREHLGDRGQAILEFLVLSGLATGSLGLYLRPWMPAAAPWGFWLPLVFIAGYLLIDARRQSALAQSSDS